jgi:hypothetical protein
MTVSYCMSNSMSVSRTLGSRHTEKEEPVLELIIINYNMYRFIYNKYILYNGLSNYIYNEVIKFCIEFIICHEKWII